MKYISICVLYILLTLIGMTLIKMGGRSSDFYIQILHFIINIKILIGIFFYGLSFLLYTFVISKMQLSITMPLLAAINSCAIVIIGVVIFKEILNLGQVVGIAIVIIGVFVMGFFSK